MKADFPRMGAVLAALLAVVLMVGFSLVGRDGGRAALIEPEYVGRLFGKDKVVQIEITLPESELEDMLANAMQEEFHVADITVDGTRLSNVAVRTKGNSSLFSIAGSRGGSSSSRFSFKVDFNEYVGKQSLWGLKKLNLNNCYSDPSYMREYLTYEAMEEMGLATPGRVFVNLSVNGKPWGLYLGVEAIEDEFVARYFVNNKGDLYKPDGTGSDLKWISSDASDYTGMNLKTPEGRQDKSALIAFLSAVNGKGGELEDVLDVNAALRYFAVSTALGNFDSYQGQMKHNYYLYQHDGVFTVIGWDYNMSFGGFARMSTDAGAAVAIDEPVQGALSDRTLLQRLLEDETYRQSYYGYLRQVVDGFMSEERLAMRTSQLSELIAPYIGLGDEGGQALSEFASSLTGSSVGRSPALLDFASDMRQSILSQLDGELPRTADELGIASSGIGARGEGGFPGADFPAGMVPGLAQDWPGARLDAASRQDIAGLAEKAQSGNLADEDLARLAELGLAEADLARFGSAPDGFMPPDGMMQMQAGANPRGFSPDDALPRGKMPPGMQEWPVGLAAPGDAAVTSPQGLAEAQPEAQPEAQFGQQSEPQADSPADELRWSIREDFLRPQQQDARAGGAMTAGGLIMAGATVLALISATLAVMALKPRRYRA